MFKISTLLWKINEWRCFFFCSFKSKNKTKVQIINNIWLGCLLKLALQMLKRSYAFFEKSANVSCSWFPVILCPFFNFFFPNFWGLGQVHPLSPMHFVIIVAEALRLLISEAKLELDEPGDFWHWAFQQRDYLVVVGCWYCYLLWCKRCSGYWCHTAVMMVNSIIRVENNILQLLILEFEWTLNL